MRSAFVALALTVLAVFQPTINGATAQNADGSASFSQMQARMAASVFEDACVETLPDFGNFENEIRKIGAQKVGKIWQLGGRAAVFSIQSANDRKGCVATVLEAKNFEMLDALSKALKDPARPLRAGKRRENLVFLANTRSGPAVIVFTPNSQKSTASTFGSKPQTQTDLTALYGDVLQGDS